MKEEDGSPPDMEELKDEVLAESMLDHFRELNDREATLSIATTLGAQFLPMLRRIADRICDDYQKDPRVMELLDEPEVVIAALYGLAESLFEDMCCDEHRAMFKEQLPLFIPPISKGITEIVDLLGIAPEGITRKSGATYYLKKDKKHGEK